MIATALGLLLSVTLFNLFTRTGGVVAGVNVLVDAAVQGVASLFGGAIGIALVRGLRVSRASHTFTAYEHGLVVDQTGFSTGANSPATTSPRQSW